MRKGCSASLSIVLVRADFLCGVPADREKCEAKMLREGPEAEHTNPPPKSPQGGPETQPFILQQSLRNYWPSQC